MDELLTSDLLKPNQEGFVKNIVDLTPEDKAALRERVIKWKGKVRMFVHPYFEQYHLQDTYNDNGYAARYLNPNKQAVIDRALEKMCSLPEDRMPPLFICEGVSDVERTQSKLNSFLQTSKSAIYIIPTFDESSTPKFSDNTGIQDPTRWEALFSVLNELGVRFILLGGIFFTLDEYNGLYTPDDLMSFRAQEEAAGAQNTDFYLGGCAGRAAMELSKEFNIEVSNLASPKSGFELRKLEGR